MAALLVFGLHLRNLGYLNGAPVDIVGWAFMAGATGVSFFFVLSGFVLTWSARSHDTAAGFWRRRIARIYPVHLATAAVAMFLGSAVLGQPRPTNPQLAANVLLIHSWWPAWWQTLNPVSWSLACEAFFYATFPAVAWVLQRLGHRALSALGAAAIAGVIVLPWANTQYALGLVLFSSPLARLPEFILGAVLARLVHLGRWRGPGLKTSSAIAVTGYILASLASSDFAFASCTIIGFALLIPAAAVADLHDQRSLWRHPALIRLGELSFAFYMVHILVLHAASVILTTLPAPTGAAAALTTSLTLSWLIYEGVERPARQLILSLSRDHNEITNHRPAAPSRVAVTSYFAGRPAILSRRVRDARVTGWRLLVACGRRVPGHQEAPPHENHKPQGNDTPVGSCRGAGRGAARPVFCSGLLVSPDLRRQHRPGDEPGRPGVCQLHPVHAESRCPNVRPISPAGP
jgi:peptidoglycan/LPS O-acetylase OafA/YrhL